MSGRDKVDAELEQIISKVSKLQTSLGGGESKDASKSHLGEDGKVDYWEELKEKISNRFTELKTLSNEIADLRSGAARESQNDRIRKEQEHRSNMLAVDKEVKEMDDMHRSEAKKKRSKYSKADLEIRANEVAQLKRQLEDFKEFSRRGFVGNRDGYSNNRLVKMEDSELFNKDPSKPNEQKRPQETITSEQQQSMLQIEKRDAEIDRALEGVGQGVDMLHELALIQNQKVKESSIMLDSLNDKMEDVQEHVLTVNDRLKETLELARSSDKLCMVRMNMADNYV
jgi:hypothetical protein